MKYYVLFSKSLGCANRPFIADSDSHACAMIRNAILANQDPHLTIDRSDYDLYRVGSFDPDKMKFENKKVLVCNASQISIPDIDVGGAHE